MFRRNKQCGGGMFIKTDDVVAVPLCWWHHSVCTAAVKWRLVIERRSTRLPKQSPRNLRFKLFLWSNSSETSPLWRRISIITAERIAGGTLMAGFFLSAHSAGLLQIFPLSYPQPIHYIKALPDQLIFLIQLLIKQGYIPRGFRDSLWMSARLSLQFVRRTHVSVS